MAIISIFLVHLVALISVAEGAKPAVPQTCTLSYSEIDWQQPRLDLNNFLPYPGVIFSGDANVTFSEVLDFVGLMWNAKSPAAIAGLFCTYYGPYVDALNPDDSTVRKVCNQVVTSLAKSTEIDFSKECRNASNILQQQLSYQIKEYICDYDSDYSDPFYNFTFYQEQVSNTNLECEIYNFVASNRFSLNEILSRVAFSVLDWLGPSPFSGDFYGACSALRFFSNMRIDNIVDKLKLIAKAAITEGLELFYSSGGCDIIDDQIQQDIDRLLFWNQQDLCAFFERNPLQDDYNRKANEIIDTILSIPVDEELCVNFVTLLAENLPNGVLNSFEKVTGFNISMAEQRRFCIQVTDSLSGRSQYTPSTYVFSRTEDILTYWYTDEPGELLPNFYFTDAADVLGAFIRSEKVADGFYVLCSVFGPFLNEYEVQVDDSSNVGELCSALESLDFDAIERLCRAETVPYYNDIPLVRVPTARYSIVIEVDALRQLFKLEELSPQSFCEAFNTFLNSANNLQTVTRRILLSYVAEMLPIANDFFCIEYDDVLRTVQKTGGEETLIRINDAVLTFLGFSKRSDLCRSITNGIDETSGRATDESTNFFLTKLLQFLTDEKRCTKGISALKVVLTDLNLGQDVDQHFKEITGYSTTEELCVSVVSSFADKCSGATVLRLCSPVVMLAMLLATTVLRN